jgi:energy-coupling factor transporter transmembrane protein EcfT
MKPQMPTNHVKSLIRALRELPAIETPPGLHQRIMQALPRRRGFRGRLEYAFRRFPAASIAPRVKQALSLPSTPGEMALVFMHMGVFFLIICLILILRLDPALIAAGSGLIFYLCLAPSLAGAGVLLRLGWKVISHPGALRDSGKGIVFPAALFSLTAFGGLLLEVSRELVMISSWLGLSGLAATGFLAFAWRCCFKEVCA